MTQSFFRIMSRCEARSKSTRRALRCNTAIRIRFPEKGWRNRTERCMLVQNPPAKPLTQQEMDDVYALPYCRTWHPMYDAAGGIPAISEVKFSLVSNRGCFGGCNFCALTMHQGRIVQTRSHASILAEARQMTEDPEFKGYIHDVGGPTANFRHPSCEKQLTKGVCQNRQCLFPKPCPESERRPQGLCGTAAQA